MSLPVSYAGIVLPLATQEAIDWARAELDFDWTQEFVDRGWPGPGLERMPWRGIPLPRGQVQLNSLSWPLGASKFAVAHFIVDLTSLNAIRSVTQTTTTTSTTSTTTTTTTATTTSTTSTTTTSTPPGCPPGLLQASPLVLGPDFTTDMYMLPARPLSYAPDGNPLYLLTLVDERFYWQFRGANIAITEGTTTWANLYSAIATALNITLTPDAVAAVYLKPSAAMAASYLSLPVLLDAVALSCGQRIVRNYDGTVSAINATTSAFRMASNIAAQQDAGVFTNCRAGGLFAYDPSTINDLAPILPQSVTVAFRKAFVGAVQQERYPVTVNFCDLSLPTLQGLQTSVFSGTKTFRDDAVVNLNLAGVPDSSAQATALAQQIATDFYLFAGGGQVAISLADFVNWEPEGFSDEITLEWGNGRTRINPGAFSDYAEELFHLSAPCISIHPTHIGLTLDLIPARVGSAHDGTDKPGCGRVEIYSVNTTTSTTSTSTTTSAGTTTSTTSTTTSTSPCNTGIVLADQNCIELAYNILDSDIPSGSYVWMIRDPNSGKLVIVSLASSSSSTTGPAVKITGIVGVTNTANPTITTDAPHGLVAGTNITISSVLGATGVNGAKTVLAIISTTTFTITNSSPGVYISGGIIATKAYYLASVEAWSDGSQIFSETSPCLFLPLNSEVVAAGRRYGACVAFSTESVTGMNVYASDPKLQIIVETTNNGSGDSTVTVTGVTDIKIDQASGLKLTNASGVVTVSAQDASLSHKGIVTTAAQSIGGVKTFASGTVDGSTTIGTRTDVAPPTVLQVNNRQLSSQVIIELAATNGAATVLTSRVGIGVFTIGGVSHVCAYMEYVNGSGTFLLITDDDRLVFQKSTGAQTVLVA